jgi:hypothetical protein
MADKKKTTTNGFPQRLTYAWCRKEIPGMTEARRDALVAELARRGWYSGSEEHRRLFLETLIEALRTSKEEVKA